MKQLFYFVVMLLIMVFASAAVLHSQAGTKSKGRTYSSPEQLIAELRKKTESIHPKNGFVPDELTAVKIAEAVLVPIYGKKQIESERPFKATLTNDVWTVLGTLKPKVVGGTAEVRISKMDGRILFVNHWM